MEPGSVSLSKKLSLIHICVKWSLRNTSEIVEYWDEVLLGIKYWIEREQTELKYEPSAEEKAAGIAQFSLVVGEMATITALAKDLSLIHI